MTAFKKRMNEPPPILDDYIRWVNLVSDDWFFPRKDCPLPSKMEFRVTEGLADAARKIKDSELWSDPKLPGFVLPSSRYSEWPEVAKEALAALASNQGKEKRVDLWWVFCEERFRQYEALQVIRQTLYGIATFNNPEEQLRQEFETAMGKEASSRLNANHPVTRGPKRVPYLEFPTRIDVDTDEDGNPCLEIDPPAIYQEFLDTIMDIQDRHPEDMKRIRACVMCGDIFWAKRIPCYACDRHLHYLRQRIYELRKRKGSGNYNKARRKKRASSKEERKAQRIEAISQIAAQIKGKEAPTEQSPQRRVAEIMTPAVESDSSHQAPPPTMMDRSGPGPKKHPHTTHANDRQVSKTVRKKERRPLRSLSKKKARIRPTPRRKK